jgi:arginase family enzyme
MFTRIIAPIWQGNTRADGIKAGALQLHQALGGTWLEVDNHANLQKTDHIKAKPELLGVQQNLQQEIAKHQKIALLGGDCSGDFALLAHSSRQHHPDLAVVWFDTHADLNKWAFSRHGVAGKSGRFGHGFCRFEPCADYAAPSIFGGSAGL